MGAVHYGFGTTMVKAADNDDHLSPGTSDEPAVQGRMDSAEEILQNYRHGSDSLRIEISRSQAMQLNARQVDTPTLAHLWSHFDPEFTISSGGAEHAHVVFMALLKMRPQIEQHFRAVHGKARARMPGTIHALATGSLASSTAPALVVFAAGLLRSIFTGSERGSNATCTFVAAMPGPYDGTNMARHNMRRVMGYATAEVIGALSSAVHERRKHGGVEIPGVGRLTKPPYDAFWLSTAEACGAETVPELANATRFLTLLLDDRKAGIGKLIADDLVRGPGSSFFPPLQGEGRMRARVYGLLAAAKVVVDRRALSRRAAKHTTIAFLRHLLRGADQEPQRLADRYRETIANDVLYPEGPTGSVYEPRRGDLSWEVPMPPTPEAWAKLEEQSDALAQSAINRWETEQKGTNRRNLEHWFDQLLAERLVEGSLASLPEEFAGLAGVLADDAEGLRAGADAREEDARAAFEAVLSGRQRRGWLRSLLAPFSYNELRVTAVNRAHSYSLQQFRSHRDRAMADALDEQRELAEQRAGTFARDLLDEVAAQLGDQGPYQLAIKSGWKALRHPAPTITRLYCTPESFLRLYHKQVLLEQQLPSGKVTIVERTFQEAVAALTPDILAALAGGKEGFVALTQAVEEYFTRQFTERWARLHLSAAPEGVRRAALRAAAERINPTRFVERVDSDRNEDYFYVEYPADDPGLETLEAEVRDCAPTAAGFKSAHHTHRHESALILAGVSSALALDDIVELRGDGEVRSLYLAALRAFHDRNHPNHIGAVPVFPSRWFEYLVARYDPEVRAIVGCGMDDCFADPVASHGPTVEPAQLMRPDLAAD